MAHTEFQKQTKVVFGLVDTTGTGDVNSDFIPMGEAHHCAVIIVVGTLANDVVFTLRESIIPGTSPGGDQAISGKTVTLGAGESDSISILECEASELDVAGGFKNISVRSAAVGAAEVMCIIIRSPLRFEPASLVT